MCSSDLMSHMWFGDLVTMTWWEDTWLQESFADYMGFRVAADACGYVGAQASFEIGQKPAAYAADRRRSTHPVAARPEDVPDVDAAATIFDAISYAKGNAVLRQLVTWLGDEAFLAGVEGGGLGGHLQGSVSRRRGRSPPPERSGPAGAGPSPPRRGGCSRGPWRAAGGRAHRRGR